MIFHKSAVNSGAGENYCCNCGFEVCPEDLYCSRCGEQIKTRPENDGKKSSTSTMLKLSFLKMINRPRGQKKLSKDSLPNNTLILILICFFGCLSIISSTYVLVSDNNNYGNSSNSQADIQKEKNIQLCEQLVMEYNGSHIYIGDIYNCGDMAQDVWDMLRAKGINARIAVGDFEHGTASRTEYKEYVQKNLDSENFGIFTTYNYTDENTGLLNSSMIDNLTHAWVLAEVSPGDWLAIECTGGYVVSSEDNGKYYHGLTFSNPKDYRNFLDLYSSWQNQIKDYKNEQLYCNELLTTYNNANYSEQSNMEGNIESEEDRLREKKETFLKTDSKLQALLRYG